jgi:U3 small nucleolar RNA-associated protein 21
VLIANEELINGLRNLRAQQKKETARLREMVGYALGTLGFLRSSA